MIIQNIKQFPDLANKQKISFDAETKEDGSIEGFSMAWFEKTKIKGFYCPINNEIPEESKYRNVNRKEVDKWLLPVLRDKKRKFVFHNAAFDAMIIEKVWGVTIPIGQIEDTMLQHWVYDTERDHGLKDIMEKEYGFDVVKYKEAKEDSFENFAKYGENDSKYSLFLDYKQQKQLIKKPKTYSLYRDVEMPFVDIMMDMNYRNNFIRIDESLLRRYVNNANREKKIFDKIT